MRDVGLARITPHAQIFPAQRHARRMLRRMRQHAPARVPPAPRRPARQTRPQLTPRPTRLAIAARARRGERINIHHPILAHVRAPHEPQRRSTAVLRASIEQRIDAHLHRRVRAELVHARARLRGIEAVHARECVQHARGVGARRLRHHGCTLCADE